MKMRARHSTCSSQSEQSLSSCDPWLKVSAMEVFPMYKAQWHVWPSDVGFLSLSKHLFANIAWCSCFDGKRDIAQQIVEDKRSFNSVPTCSTCVRRETFEGKFHPLKNFNRLSIIPSNEKPIQSVQPSRWMMIILSEEFISKLFGSKFDLYTRWPNSRQDWVT